MLGSDLITYLVLGGIFAVLFNNRPGRSNVPTLILRRFYAGDEKDGFYVDIVGRSSGIIGWLLTLLGLEAETSLSATRESIIFKKTSLNGEETNIAPLNAISSTHSGYIKNIGLLFFGVAFVAFGLVMLFQRNGFFGFVVAAAIGGYLLFRYWLDKRITVTVQTTGGAVMGLSFSRSLIEGVYVDAKRAYTTITIINRLIHQARGLEGAPISDLIEPEKPKNPPVHVPVERE